MSDQNLRVKHLERVIDRVIHELTYGEASFALHPSSMSLDDDTKASLRACLTLLRDVQAKKAA